MAKDPSDNARIFIRTSAEVLTYLDQLAAIGIHGKTRSEVAKTFVGNEIERMIREGILQIKRPKIRP